MCDQHFEDDLKKYLNETAVTRRQFGTLSVGVGLAMLLPRSANALAVAESNVDIKTPDGFADCYFVHPSSGAHAGVLIWPDILGLRSTLQQIGKRLAESGYSVLVVNPFYRQKRSPVVPPGSSWADESVRKTVMPLFSALTATTQVTDAKAFLTFLDNQAVVDKKRKIGTVGYCMGGETTMRTAAIAPARVGAAASFHGSGLVTDQPDSPHLLVANMKAQYLFAIAENDDRRSPQEKNVLREAFAKAMLPAEIEVYAGAGHGWCVSDFPVYNEAQAERAWSRLLVLFEKALA
jgi:carboxymethylenebutenolidase